MKKPKKVKKLLSEIKLDNTKPACFFCFSQIDIFYFINDEKRKRNYQCCEKCKMSYQDENVKFDMDQIIFDYDVIEAHLKNKNKNSVNFLNKLNIN